jgi:N-acetylglutamate synthase-like GNAT family acetyltransferase
MAETQGNDGKTFRSKTRAEYNPFRQVRPSIALNMIRHAESANNEVYRNAKFLFRAGTDDFDEEGCTQYVNAHRKADPELSTKGFLQAEALADYLVPHLENQASHPVRILCSPMKRTLLTIRPTLERLHRRRKEGKNRQSNDDDNSTDNNNKPVVHVIVVAFYHETEGCHLKGIPEQGMNPREIREFFKNCVDDPIKDVDFVGFRDDVDVGWYAHGTGPESRVEAEQRAAKYCLWLSEYLDEQLLVEDQDLFDAGILVDGEDQEDEHDKHAQRIRRRRTALAVGHGDFMSSVLKRIVSGFGHIVETEGIPHRSAFAHYNTGITELEYFGHGRYLVMAVNTTPHILPQRYQELRSGGTLRDGWSFLVPPVLDPEVEVVFSDDTLEDHVREQTAALKALYLSSAAQISSNDDNTLQVEEGLEPKNETHFVVKRGHQVVGFATYSEETGRLTDVAIRPSAATRHSGEIDSGSQQTIAETLMAAVKNHARKLGRTNSLIVHPRSFESKALFEQMGFTEIDDGESTDKMETGL